MNKKITYFFQTLYAILGVLLLPFLFLLVVLIPKKRDTLIWGCEPIISNKYWSNAMKAGGYKSMTLMATHYGVINDKKDFDKYYADFFPKFFQKRMFVRLFGPFFAFIYIIRHAKVLHSSLVGGPLSTTSCRRFEAFLLKLAGINIVVMTFGGDTYVYSKVMNVSWRHGLLTHYPKQARIQQRIEKSVRYWERYADCFLADFTLDGVGRSDVIIFQHIVINTNQWNPKKIYSQANGKNAVVKIIHTPNHRVIKATEFFIAAVETLRQEGLQIEVELLEKIPNTVVREKMYEADILFEQCILPAHGLNGLEGMATGLPVLSNLEDSPYTKVFKTHSYLNECPIYSTTVETLTERLRELVTNPKLRESVGKRSRAYVEKYHSYRTAQYLFSNIYAKICEKKDIDLMRLFHPLYTIYK